MLKQNERIDQFPQSKIKIIQSDDTFAVSTDTILLVDFAHPSRSAKERVVDFCSGNGAVPLLLSEQTQGRIVGLELQEDLVDMANRAVALNQLAGRVQIRQNDIKEAHTLFDHDSVDLVTCNPPYFKVHENSWINPNDRKALARHEIAMTAEDVFVQAAAILKDRGHLVMVHRPERLSELVRLGYENHLLLKRLRFVYPKPEREANVILLDFMKNGQEEGLHVEPPLYVYNQDDTYSEEMQAIINGPRR